MGGPFRMQPILGFGSSGGMHTMLSIRFPRGLGGGPCWPRPDSSVAGRTAPAQVGRGGFLVLFGVETACFHGFVMQSILLHELPCMGVRAAFFVGKSRSTAWFLSRAAVKMF